MKVSFVRCKGYQNAEKSVKEAVIKCGFSARPKRVLIKPNILSACPPEGAVNTHPEIVKAAIRLFPKSKVIVGESSGARTEQALRASGIRAAAEELGAEVVSFEGQEMKRVPIKNQLIKEFYIPKMVFDSDLVVNLPKLKTHCLMKYTGAIKNLYGCIPGASKIRLHHKADTPEKFGEMLADLYSAIRPGLNIMDGIVGMDGFGPSNGNPRRCNIIAASMDAAALDIPVCRMIGLRPEEVPTNSFISSKGYFKGKVEVVGNAPSFNFSIPRLKPISSVGSLVMTLPSHKIIVNTKKCTKCRTCIGHCPVKAIDSNFNVNHNKCILCFCCHELCPANAIIIKKNFWLRVYDLGRFLADQIRIRKINKKN